MQLWGHVLSRAQVVLGRRETAANCGSALAIGTGGDPDPERASRISFDLKEMILHFDCAQARTWRSGVASG